RADCSDGGLTEQAEAPETQERSRLTLEAAPLPSTPMPTTTLRSLALAGLATIAAASSIAAQAPTMPPAPKVIVIHAARMLDVAKGQIVSPAVVTIEGDHIRSIGQTSDTGARLINLGDLTLLPALIDVHVHLTYDVSGDWVMRPVRETAADEALRGAANANKTLMAGFTTVRNVGAGGFSDVSLM